MAPVGKLRKALGVVKDQTSISLAKVSSSQAPDLDVAIVKATSHDDVPSGEKYVQEILFLTSCYRGYVSVCVKGLTKRLSKTHNWIVAIKTLMLIHRLLKDGDPAFEEELLFMSRRILTNVSNFRDDSDACAWDYTAFVRTYGKYLNGRLDCFASSTGHASRSNPRGDTSNRDERRSGYDNYDSDYSTSYNYDRRKELPRRKQACNNLVKDMTPEMLLEKLPLLQRLLERIFACRPTGAAKHHRLVQIALNSIVGESFQIYSEICEGTAMLLDGFFEMEHQDCVRTFDIYARSSKQAEELAAFYSVTIDAGIRRSTEYPTVQKISQEQLDNLEDYLKDRSRSSLTRQKMKSPEPVPDPVALEAEPQMENEVDQDFTAIRALPAPPVEQTISEEQIRPDIDLINLEGETMSAEEHENKLALALFTSASTGGNGSWETFGSEQVATAEQSTAKSSPWQDYSESEKTGWEVALVTEASKLSKAAESSLAGGFNRLLLDSMYEQANVTQKYSSAIPSGSASSVVQPGKPPSSFLALPAPVPPAGEDPFAASVGVPPPSYVQMADLRQKQQLLMQEQLFWQQYQRDGMQGTAGIAKVYNNYLGFVPQNPLYFPYRGVQGFTQSGYAYH